MRVIGLGDLGAPQTAGLLQRLLGHERRRSEHSRRIALAGDVVAVEREHVGEVAVQGGQHLHGSQATRIEHTVQHDQRPSGSPLSMASVSS